MRYFSIVLTALLLLSPLSSLGAEQLPYGIRDAVKRQTQNMGEIEREIEKMRATVDAGPNLAQQALMAQFQQMLAANPQLKAQFEAATPEQQAAFMAQLGITTAAPGSGMMNQYGWLEQRLDGVQAVIDRAPADHPDIIALAQRVDAARAAIKSTESDYADNANAALAANDLSDFPNFEQDLATANAMTSEIADAVNGTKAASALAGTRGDASEMWLLNNSLDFRKLTAVKRGLENAAGYQQQINAWQQQYSPLFARSQVYAAQWNQNMQYLPQLIAGLNNQAPAALQLLAQNVEHNTQVLDAMVQMAIDKRVAAYFDGGIRQVHSAINAVVEVYPDVALPGTMPRAQIVAMQQQAANRVSEGLAGLQDLVVAEQRMPPSKYEGDDADELEEKAIAFIERRFPGEDILDVSLCCDWDVTQYEEIVEVHPGQWEKRVHDYRDIWIAVLMPRNDERAVIRVVGIRQNFVTDKETVELIREREMLVENI